MSAVHPPYGFRWTWEPDPAWTTSPDVIHGKRCRAGAGYRHRACGRRAVAAMDRGRFTNKGRIESWWCYCADHLYGRKLVGGVVLRRIALPTNQRITIRGG